jgi:hypothetical protein
MTSTVPSGRGPLGIATQALRAWLLSDCPSGTKAFRPSKRLIIILALMGRNPGPALSKRLRVEGLSRVALRGINLVLDLLRGVNRVGAGEARRPLRTERLHTASSPALCLEQSFPPTSRVSEMSKRRSRKAKLLKFHVRSA